MSFNLKRQATSTITIVPPPRHGSLLTNMGGKEEIDTTEGG